MQSKTAPVLASYLPARYYAVYRQRMALYASALPRFADLPRTTLEEGCAPLLLRPADGQEPPNTVQHALTKSPRLLVLGVAGAGKSTLLRYLAWYFTRHQDATFVQHLTFRLFGQAMDELMPLLLDLGAWAGSGVDLEEALLSTLAAHGFPASAAFLRRRLEAGQCLLLLDNLDQLHTSAQRAQVARLAAAYPQNIWVITLRPIRPLPDLPGFGAYRLQGIDAAQLPEFIRYNLGRVSPESVGLLAACERHEGLARLAEIPLLNASMCHALQHQMVQTVTVPPLFDACVKALLYRDGALNDGGQSGQCDAVRLLQRIAYQMQAQERDHTDYDEIIRLAREQCPNADLHALVSLGDELIWQAGLLQPCASGDAYAFAMPGLQSYLAASWIVAQGQADTLIPLADAHQWREVIVFTAGLLPDATAFVRELAARARQEPDKWFLLADCLAEAQACDPALRQDISQKLITLLKQESSACWQPALRALAGMAGKQVQEYLNLLLLDEQAETRRLAALTLGRLQREWAIPALDAALTDLQMDVRQQAVWALGRIPSPQAARVLTRALHSQFDGVSRGAVQALAELGRVPGLLPVVMQQLVPLLGQGDGQPTHRAVTDLAEEALSEIGRAGLAELIALMNDPRLEPAQRFRLARVVGQLGDERALVTLVEALLHANADDLEGYLQAIACLGAAAVPALLAALEGHDVHTGATLVMALARIGSPAVELLVDALADDSNMREVAVCALEQIGVPAVEPLVRVLLHDARADVRKRALAVLKRMGDSRSVRLLAQAATQGGDPDTSLSAIRSLGELAQPEALQPLVSLLENGGEVTLRRAALTSLGLLRDAQAVPSLLAALRDPSLRETAVDALTGFGELAVEPLIRQLHAPDAGADLRQAAWDALEKIGARASADGGRLLALAATYARLRDERLDAGELLTLTLRLGWWKHGAELHYSLRSAQALAAATDMDAIAQSDSHLNWLAGHEEWLRPQVKDILWGLADIIAGIQFCRKMSRRDSQREALLACLERLQGLEQRMQTCLPFERALLGEVVCRWRAALTHALDQLRGQASLFIELLTPTLPLRDSQRIATAVFQLFNEGDSPARNLSVAVRPGALSGVQVLGGEERELDPLGVGEERHLEVNIAPNGTDRAEVLFEARYDDEERKGAIHRFSCQLAFVEVADAYQPIESSPYIAGTPVKTPEMFFGRQDVFDWVRESIQGKQQNALVLYGERRMGKTSLLYQLDQKPPTPQYLPLLFDLQLYSYIHTLSELFWELAQAILARLARAGLALEGPDWQAYDENPYQAFLGLCDLLNSRLGDQRLVVMMDEFGVLLAQIRDGVLDASILDFIRGIIQRTNRLTFLFTGAVEMRRLQQELRSTLFNTAKVYRISYLSPGEATELITRPVEGLLTFHPLVIHRICEVTACHPYFIQYICDDLVQLARVERKNYLEPGDLDYVLREVVRDTTGNIEGNIYHFLNGAERAALAALAAITDEVRVFVPLEDIAAMLERRHLSLPKSQLMRALQGLQERELVAERRMGQQLYYAFRMGLVRMWLRQNEILLRLSQEQPL
ncbi:MAG: hypothetical protein GX552_04760 [Chloroflexi bacterium]|nr:hypothetical protein [Chloroflexota bacterium]